MKNYIKLCLLLIITTSCTKDYTDSNSEANGQVLTNYIFKTYNVTNTPNTIIDSTNYLIDGNKILNSNSVNIETMNQKNSDYIYENNRISKIESYDNGVLSRIQYYIYDDNGELVEYRSESIDDVNNTSFINKHLFESVNDTIFSEWLQSSDGITFNVIKDVKMVLDNNTNRIYFEAYDYINDKISFTNNVYLDNNLISEERFEFITPDNTELMISNIYSYDLGVNLFSVINEATYSRKTLMLLYHTKSSAINNYNAKAVSKNPISNFSSSFGGGNFYSLETINILNDLNINVSSDFRTIINSNLFSRFSQEFVYSSM